MERIPRSPEDYLDWARHQYEHTPDPRAVRHVFAQRPLTHTVLRKPRRARAAPEPGAEAGFEVFG